MDKNLSLRTGEHAEDGQGRERLRLFWCKGDIVKIKISFPMYNSETEENFWMFCETTFGKSTAQDIIDYLETWPDQTIQFDTGENLKESISFAKEWIDSENAPGKKIRIFIPAFSLNGKPRMALTLVNITNAKIIIEFLNAFIKEENFDPTGKRKLQKKIQTLTDKVDVLSRRLAEEIAKNEHYQHKHSGIKTRAYKPSRAPLMIQPT